MLHLQPGSTNYLTGRPQYVRLEEHPIGHHCEQHAGRHRGRSCLPSCLHSTPQTSGSVRSSPATCRSFQMTLPSWAVSAGARRRSTGVWWTEDRGPVGTQLSIRGTEMDIVDSYKYLLGVYLDNKLDWTINTDAIYKN
ncbi:hypothetical protein L3Q82_016920, partial [Scortum barcoo]